MHGDYLGLSRWPKCNHIGPQKQRTSLAVFGERWDWMNAQRDVTLLALKTEVGREPRNAGSLQKLEKAGK